MLIGQTLELSFARYLMDGGVPAGVGLALVWLVVWLPYRRRWERATPLVEVHAPPLDRWQLQKGIAVISVVMVAFLFRPGRAR